MNVDWQTLYERLQTAGSRVESQTYASEEKVRQVLKSRAEKLARTPARVYGPGECIDVLAFQLGSENYAMDISLVREVRQLQALTPLPGVPAFIKGIINIRGHIYSVVDLKIVFELPRHGTVTPDKVIVIAHEDMAFGILADEITGVRQVLNEGIQPSLPVLAGPRQQYFKGITKERLILLDARKLLADKAMLINQEQQVRGPDTLE